MNTKICYLYRDAANYKVWHKCIVSGKITREQIGEIVCCLEGGCWFKADMVQLPDERFSFWSEDKEIDHPWFELSENSFEYTDEAVDTYMTATELVDLFHDAKKRGWEEEHCD